jgi:cytochrome c5
MRKFLIILGSVIGALAALLAIGYLVAGVQARARLDRKFETHQLTLSVPFPLPVAETEQLRADRAAAEGGEPGAAAPVALDPAALAAERAIASGKHLVHARYSCNACHGANLAGGIMMDEPPVGSIHGPNLTSGQGGVVAGFTMADWDRIVRHGVKRDGTQAVMPSEDYFAMSDHELSDIIAYIRSLPAVDGEQPKPVFGPIGKVLLALGKYPLSAERVPDHMKAHAVEPPTEAASAEFGAHLAATCLGCHRANLAGGPMQFGPPDWPPASNLTRDPAGLHDWTFEDFEKALTEGVSRDGHSLRPPMTHVVPGTRAMKQIERKAIWTYLRSLKPHPTNP